MNQHCRITRKGFFILHNSPFILVTMLPDSINALIAALAKLPGVGPRSAERIALHIVQADVAAAKNLETPAPRAVYRSARLSDR